MNSRAFFRSVLPLFLMFWVSAATAGPVDLPASFKEKMASTTELREESIFEKIWDYATLYESETGFLNELSLTGRYHGRYFNVESDTANHDDGENRRIRAGIKGRYLQNFEFNFQADIRTAGSEHYGGLTDAYLRWKPSKTFTLSLGKEPLDFTYEGSISSNNISTFERSMLVNMLWPNPEYLTGASISGRLGRVFYKFGVYAGDLEKEYSRFTGGYGYLGSLGYDFSEVTGLEASEVRLQYFFNDGDPDNTAFRSFESSVSVNFFLKQGPAAVAVDFLAAKSLDHDNDVYGVTVLPTYDLTSRLQWVGRYQFATSQQDEGLSAASRYEREAGGGRGDTYHAVYMGFNYFLHGHKLKLMGGVEYAVLSNDVSEGYEGWTGMVGVVFSF